MSWCDIAYEIIGPDATRAVVGNGDAARADPDWVGWLNAESNIQGLLDPASITGSGSNLVERDGRVLGPSFMNGRSGTITGFFDANLTPTVIAGRESKLKRASRALRADGTLRWTPPNDSTPRQLRFRRQDGPRVTGRRPKTFQLTLECGDPFALGSTLQTLTITAGAAAGEVGISDPFRDPISSPLNPTAQQTVQNAGDAPVWPYFRITGPITNPVLLNNTSGESVVIAYTLNAGEWLDIYPERGAVLAQGTADRYGSVDFVQTSWWQLQPGSTDVRLLASTFSSPAALTINWRNGFE